MAQKKSRQAPPFWLHRGVIAYLLWPLSLVFGFIAAKRKKSFNQPGRSYRAPVPVIVVGNLIVGGAGKTPTIISLINHFVKQGHIPGVISRGYGRADENKCQEVFSHMAPELAGDEPLLIHRKTGVPVFVAAKRIEAIKELLKKYPRTTHIVSDDGLQHYAFARDIEIVVFDERGVGNGFLLPAGPLREPLSRVTSKNLILFNAKEPSVPLAGFMAKRGFLGWLPLQQWAAKNQQTSWQDINTLVQKQKESTYHIAAIAGIGQPQRFFDMLEQSGIQLYQAIALPDHDHFTNAESIFSNVDSDLILITEKDATKCAQLLPIDQQNKVGVVGFDYQPEQAFFNKLDTMLNQLHLPADETAV